MRRYAAFLRGVMPTNAKMAELRRAFEEAGFDAVKTVLGSGNVVFSAKPLPQRRLERKAEAAMEKRLGRSFLTFVRAVDELHELLEKDPFARFRVPKNARRVVTLLREPAAPRLPAVLGGARIVAVDGATAFGFYVPTPGDPAFMRLIEKTFGKNVTTRTWETIRRVAS